VDTRPSEKTLDFEILDVLAGVFARLLAEGEEQARAFGIPAFVLKALHLMDGPLAMKELGKKMKCDPSFVTGIADMLERRGLACREPDPADRRVKRLRLTADGEELRGKAEHAMGDRLPWRQSLSLDERHCLLMLLRKIAGPISATQDLCPAEEVSKLLAATKVPGSAGPVAS
jgi:DNA-binding MarR family transcriptional regulator